MLPLSVSAGQNMTRDNVSELKNVGFVIDDKNEPVPNKIPVANTVQDVTNTTIDKNAIATEGWLFDGVDHCRTSGGGAFSPTKLKTTDSSSIPRM